MSAVQVFIREGSLVQRVLQQLTGRNIADLPDMGSNAGTGIQQCQQWLALNHVPVLIAVSSRAGDYIVVPDCPAIYSAIKPEDRTWNNRRRIGVFNVYRWFAVRFGVTVLWEQYECVA